MEHGPFEDMFPIKNGDIPCLYWLTREYLGGLGCYEPMLSKETRPFGYP